MIWFWLIFAFVLIGCLIHDVIELEAHKKEMADLQADLNEAVRILTEHNKRNIERIAWLEEERRRG